MTYQNESASTVWRASGTYLPTATSKAGILAETRQFLLAYRRLGDPDAARQWLVARGLPQRSRATRATIARIIAARLTSWNPPRWVLDDLAGFAIEDDPAALRAALLLHTARQDAVLYDLIQQVVAPRWLCGEREISRGDVQRFLDTAQPTHPEVDRWTRGTREKLAGNLLTVLRDYGVLQGAWRTTRREIVEPVVPPAVVEHLVRLLRTEGVPGLELAEHPDWRLWLWDRAHTRAALAAVAGVSA